MYRRSESPAITFLHMCMVAAVAASATLVEGVKVRECPPRLSDGRSLRSINLVTKDCGYAPAPARMLDWYSSKELRGIAATRDRLGKVKP